MLTDLTYGQDQIIKTYSIREKLALGLVAVVILAGFIGILLILVNSGVACKKSFFVLKRKAKEIKEEHWTAPPNQEERGDDECSPEEQWPTEGFDGENNSRDNQWPINAEFDQGQNDVNHHS